MHHEPQGGGPNPYSLLKYIRVPSVLCIQVPDQPLHALFTGQAVPGEMTVMEIGCEKNPFSHSLRLSAAFVTFAVSP